MLLLAPLACALLEEQRAAPTEVVWSGWVYAELPGADAPLLEAGTLTAWDLDGEPLAEGTMAEDAPGYWSLTLPAATELELRLDGDEQAAMRWRGRSPAGRGYWLSGALFTVGDATAAAFFEALDGWQGLQPRALSGGEVAHLWGQPWEPEAWAGATVEVEHGGGAATVVRLAYDSEGQLIDAGTGRVDLFVAVNLEPGPVTLRVQASDGRRAETRWQAQGGELLSAFYTTLSAE